MKKKGFTLAEVLISLGIVGVIAAITLPSLVSNTGTAQIGPKLAKAVSAFEQANEAMLNAHSVDTLTDSGFMTNNSTYADEISNFLKVSVFTYPAGVAQTATGQSGACSVPSGFSSGVPLLSKDGILYVVNKTFSSPDSSKAPHKQLIGTVWVDINAAAKPNDTGTDIFAFAWYNDGSLRPVGGNNWYEGDASACSWKDVCKQNALASDYRACAGHIFENNLKVTYK